MCVVGDAETAAVKVRRICHGHLVRVVEPPLRFEAGAVTPAPIGAARAPRQLVQHVV